MNKQIKELACKALDQSVPQTWTTLTAYDLDKFTKLFAKLIIRECMAVVSRKCASHTAYKALAEHFGVKE